VSLGRKTTGGLIIVAGVALLAASPLGENLRFNVRARLSGVAYRHDPVAPFCQAPCYARGPAEGADALTEQREALP
jgi:hypothetical protein